VGGFPWAVAGDMFSNAIGTYFDYQSSKKDRQATEDINAENRLLARESNAQQRELAERNIALQKEFAQSGIRWKVEDAKAAGLHPLYALGANTQGFSPVSIMDSAPTLSPVSRGGEFRAMGQGISRAVNAANTMNERRLHELQLINMDLQNERLATEIQLMRSPGTGPGLPSNSEMPLLTGQGNSVPTAPNMGGVYVNEQPLNRVHSQPGRPAQDVGAITDYAYVRTPNGYAVVPSADAKQRIEDQLLPEIMWSLRNNVRPFFSGHPPPNPKYYPPPKGFVGWRWDWQTQEFVPTKELHFKMRRR